MVGEIEFVSMNYTPVHNRFWSDGWIRELNALDRYLFLYLLTNGRAHPTGVYELPLDLMAAESGIDEKDLRLSMLQRLEPKIYYKEGWVILINYPTHRVSNSPKLITGIVNSFEEIPRKIQEIAISYGYPIDTLSVHIPVSRNRIEENRTKEKRKELSFDVVSEKEETERVYGSSAELLDEAVSLWIPVNVAAKRWRRQNKTELGYIDLLLQEEGLEWMRKVTEMLPKTNGTRFFPVITKPSVLYEKRAELKAAMERKMGEISTKKPPIAFV